MVSNKQSIINHSEQFPHLSHAPIKEAVIEIRTRSGVSWKESELLQNLKSRLKDYPENHATRGFTSQMQFTPDQEPQVATQDLGWQGFQFISSDKKHIAKFQFDLFSFSRLEPYENWEKFSNEAFHLWEIHNQLFRPAEMERIGVRFINRFPLPPLPKVSVSDFFRTYADDLPELNMELAGFLHHETMVVPGFPYAMNVIKTVQSAESSGLEPAFILDVDVYSTQPFENKNDILKFRLQEMRWLKNKAFFGIITEELKDKLRE